VEELAHAPPPSFASVRLHLETEKVAAEQVAGTGPADPPGPEAVAHRGDRHGDQVEVVDSEPGMHGTDGKAVQNRLGVRDTLAAGHGTGLLLGLAAQRLRRAAREHQSPCFQNVCQ